MNINKKNSVALKKNTLDKKIKTDKKGVPFPVAAIGASAGGLEAIRKFLNKLPHDTGIGYVIIQHLSPDHESILPELLERETKMPVHQVKNGMAVNVDNIYVIPPDTYMSIVDGHLTLSPRKNKGGIFLPIDFFFKNLALVYQNKAIGILLSGTGSDGTAGVKDIKGEGGITFAQDSSAAFKGMPQSAIDSGFVDFILPAGEIAKELDDILKLPYLSLPVKEIAPENEGEFRKILVLLHNRKGIDFSLYKQATINRRVMRRMTLNRKKSLEDYLQTLRENESELNQLYQDLLISVTAFFRDPSVYKALTKKILPALFKDRPSNLGLKIWITACATGEEAFSFAIAISEYMSEKGIEVPFQLFATDLNPRSIEKARQGLYTTGSLENISPEHLIKYFHKIDGHYQVAKSLRDSCVFATHNLLTDPPFSKIDILSCQNVMIYFEPKAQKKILKAFHYALKPTGYLILGKSETAGSSSEIFAQADKELKIYTPKDRANAVDFDFSFPPSSIFTEKYPEADKLDKAKGNEWNVEKEMDKLLLSEYVPASVVVNNDLQIIRFHGPTSKYLQPTYGKASLQLLNMVRDDLVFELRTLIHKAKGDRLPAKKNGIHLNKDGGDVVNLEVVPLSSGFLLILFKDSDTVPAVEHITIPEINNRKIGETQRLHTLENELRDARDQLKNMSEEFEATREELQSANEEILSSNEELQSINEELETSKEELQSSNEELTTINEELHHRNEELKEDFKFREAIVETIREPLIVLKTDLRIMSANRPFYQNFHQKPHETEGHFIFEINNGRWNISGLKEKLLEINSKDKSFENYEVTHYFPELGKRIILFSGLRMASAENKKSRILLVIDDITLRREAEEKLKQSLQLNISILNSINDIFISVDNGWRFIFINEPAKKFIGEKDDLVGKNFWEILTGYIDTGFHVKLIAAMRTKSFEQFEYYDERTKEWYQFRLYPSGEALSIFANRITEAKISQQLLEQAKERYQTFISESTEGIWRFELKKPIAVSEPLQKQIKAIYENAFVGESNEAMARMHGYKSALEMKGASIKNLLLKNEGNGASLTKLIQSAYRLSDVEVAEQRGDQILYFLLNLIGVVRDGHLVRIWGTQRDITEQKITEKKLSKTRHRLNFALVAGSVGTFIWNFKKNKIVWTKIQESLYGLKNHTFKGTLNDWLSFIHPDDVEKTQKRIEKSIEEHTELSTEFRILWPDHSLHWILCRGHATFDENGIPIEMNGINIDITERKIKEWIVKENEERFRTLIQNSFDIITVFNSDGIITYQSDSIERVLGYKVEDRVGTNIFEKSIVLPEDREIEKKLFQKCTDNPNQYFLGEFRMMHVDGSVRVMEVGCVNLLNNSSIKGIIKNYRDVTERRAVEKQKEEFIGVASHELKTPVTSIKAYTQILHETLIEKKDFSSADLLSRMDNQINKLTSLIKDLLDVTKITEGKLILQEEEFDVNELVKEVVDDLQVTAKKHRIIQELADLEPIIGDKERIAQVLVNLISNAVKYSPDANKIIVKTSMVNGEIMVCVQDFGIGISKDMQKKLFQRFFRVVDDSTRTFPGLGLGLFISTEIIKRQNGRIWVESAPGKGSSFCFTLPYKK
jgi:two-component system CheB/CheR fusion protein